MQYYNVYGATGTIGSAFCKRYDKEVNVMPRDRVHSTLSGDILYLISTTHNYNVLSDPYLDINTNLIKLMSVMESWRKECPENVFNFVSSWFVYGDGYDTLPATESSPCNPKGFYSITKRTAEQLLISYADTYGLKYRILRLGNVMAPGDKGVSAQKNALQYLINKMKAGEDIEVYGDGAFYRNYVDITDVVRAIKHLMDKSDTNQIYNIGYHHDTQFIDLLVGASRELRYNRSFKYVAAKPFHQVVQTRSFKMNTDKLQVTGFRCEVSPFDALDKIIHK